MSASANLFSALRQSADPEVVDAIEELVRNGSDRELNRINLLDFAARKQLDEERVIAAFLHAVRLGIFELSWNVVCSVCRGVLDTSATLKNIKQEEYHCVWCKAVYTPSLDETVEVTFTVNRRVRRIAAHDPDELPFPEYFRQIFLSSASNPPDDFEQVIQRMMLDAIELPPGERAHLSLHLPASEVILFDPVTHATRFFDGAGEPTLERRNLSFTFDRPGPPTDTVKLQPGPVRLLLENRTDTRVLPGLWVAEKAHDILYWSKPFLSAKRMLTNQVFRDTYGVNTIDIEQHLKITSLTFLFTDLQSSTELYERIGDLAALNLVRAHFRVLTEIVAADAGAIVKTIGDAVMATFPTPARAVAAALRMREAMHALNERHGHEDLCLKIGIHAGPCLVVLLNDRQDYFGTTVNVAARVQALADSRAILATRSVINDADTSALLSSSGLAPVAQQRTIRGIAEEIAVYQIP
jgi:class 3 adenylate cyclase